MSNTVQVYYFWWADDACVDLKKKITIGISRKNSHFLNCLLSKKEIIALDKSPPFVITHNNLVRLVPKMIIEISTETIVVAMARNLYYRLRFVAAIRVKRTLQKRIFFCSIYLMDYKVHTELFCLFLAKWIIYILTLSLFAYKFGNVMPYNFIWYCIIL